MIPQWSDLILISPALSLIAWAFVVLGCGLSQRLRIHCGLVALVGCVATAGVYLLYLQPITTYGTALGGMVTWDPTARFFSWLALAIILLVVLMAMGDRSVEAEVHGEYYSLLLLSGSGMMLLGAAHHLLMIVLAMELISFSGYVLVAFQRTDARSSEAALKYFLFGALTSAILLFGLSLLYALTRSLDIYGIRVALAQATPQETSLMIIAVTMMLAGFGFKISMVPFHLWTPDAYEGAPTPVAALLSVGPKAAAFAVLTRFLMIGIGADAAHWMPALACVAALTMTLGNVTALVQTNIKRLLGYSTIAQVGYMLMGFVVLNAVGQSSVWLYLIVYALMNCGAFAIVAATTRGGEIAAFAGLSQRAPGLAAMMTMFLLSLAGIPPMAGFLGKFFLFGAAISQQMFWLVAIAAVNAVIALYYYANIIRQMYLRAPAEPSALKTAWSLKLASGLAAAGTIGIGLLPGPVLEAIHHSLALF